MKLLSFKIGCPTWIMMFIWSLQNWITTNVKQCITKNGKNSKGKGNNHRIHCYIYIYASVHGCFTKAPTANELPIFAIWHLYFRWHLESELEGFGLSKKSLLFAYFVAAANIFEPERSLERLAWAKTTALVETLVSHIKDEETRSAFVDRFINSINGQDYCSNK